MPLLHSQRSSRFESSVSQVHREELREEVLRSYGWNDHYVALLIRWHRGKKHRVVRRPVETTEGWSSFRQPKQMRCHCSRRATCCFSCRVTMVAFAPSTYWSSVHQMDQSELLRTDALTKEARLIRSPVQSSSRESAGAAMPRCLFVRGTEHALHQRTARA